eukprot:77884-Pyramimonas_sp.AAC.1
MMHSREGSWAVLQTMMCIPCGIGHRGGNTSVTHGLAAILRTLATCSAVGRRRRSAIIFAL